MTLSTFSRIGIARCPESLKLTAHAIPRILRGQDHVFRRLWSLHIPVLVHEMGNLLQARWAPEDLAACYPHEDVLMIDSRSGTTVSQKVKAAHFFSEFVRTDFVCGAIKLKDWPPSVSFADKFKRHHEAFMNAVPMPSYTRNNGLRNLAAHYPEPPHPYRSLKPDLGPKMYLATRDIDGVGSTPLHLDVTSAVNILVYASDGKPSGALWHIFLPEDLDALREYLRSLSQDTPHMDLIQARTVYLTPSMLDDLALRGIRPFRVQQQCGEAIFIPAGCAHQVSNSSACIKIACDFLCVEGIRLSAQVAEQFHQSRQENILELDSMLWHAWISLQRMLESLPPVPATNKTRIQRKRHKQRHTARGQDDQARRNQARRTGFPTSPMGDNVLRCPDVACATQSRTFPALDGLFNHLYIS
ncbi:hypothetical protein C8Q79DRAFT_998671 [Trametes meyenii]|nr:hypothetical protein C8Q79DRAFT_998671 [Trametes meyenii]